MACFLFCISPFIDHVGNQRFMRKRKIHTALLIAFASPLVPHAFADGAWQGSYSADGQCFCSGEVAAAVASQIVPTPIGGQTVKQVCTRVGQGPELNKDAGLFNYPVYEDPQCGHGPHVASSQTRDEGCMGSLDGAFELCSPKGPEWDLNQAYDVPVNLAKQRMLTLNQLPVVVKSAMRPWRIFPEKVSRWVVNVICGQEMT